MMRLHGVAKSVVVALLVTIGVVAVVGPILDSQSFLHVQERQQQQQTNRDLREMQKVGSSMAAVVEKTPTIVMEGQAMKGEMARLQQKIKFLEGKMSTMLVK